MLRQLAIRPEVVSFNSIVDLQNALDSQQQHLDEIVLDSVDQLVLMVVEHNPYMVTRAGHFALTTSALSQICTIICPGLVKALVDIAGFGQPSLASAGDEVKAVSPNIAASMFNGVVRTRFNLLAGRKLVVSRIKPARIDGIIGAGYSKLSNSEVAAVVLDLFQRSGVCEFYKATVSGRLLTLMFQQYPALISGYISSGYYFRNSEIGDSSFKMAEAVYLTRHDCRAIAPTKSGRFIHSGKDFRKRVMKAINLMSDRIDNFDPSYLRAFLADANKTSLRIEDPAIPDRFDEIVLKLAKTGIGYFAAERILTTALNQGSGTNQLTTNDPTVKKNLWKSRTLYDLFVSTARDAALRPIQLRETLEKLAYAILTNKVKV